MNTSQLTIDIRQSFVYRLINMFMIGYTAITIGRYVVHTIVEGLRFNSWGITDYLINYQGGFIRRGLLGEIIFQLTQCTGLDPRVFIIFISYTTLAFFVYILVKKINKEQLCWWILPLNICLFGAGFIRKDFLCMLFVLSTIYAYVNIQTNWKRIVLINLFLLIALNVHECILFIIYPFIFLAFYTDDRIGIKPIYRTILTLPILAMFAIISLYKGTADIAQIIHDSWNIPEMGAKPMATIESLSWDLKYAIDFHIQENFLSRTYPIYSKIEKPLLWLLVFLVIPNLLFIARKDKKIQIGIFVKILLLQFISLFPMLTVLSCDQCRIFFYWIISSLLIYLYAPNHMIERMFPHWHTRLCSKIQVLCCTSLVRTCAIYLILIIAVSPHSTRPYKAFYHSAAGAYVTSAMISYDLAAYYVEHKQTPPAKRIEKIVKKYYH